MYRLSKKIILDNKNKFILFPEGIIELNDTAFDILNECKSKTLNEIKHNIVRKYNYDNNILDDVENFIKYSIDNKIIEKVEKVENSNK